MKANLPIAAGLLLIGVTTLIQGGWSERWSEHEEIKLLAERVDKIPLQVGEWQGENIEADATILKAAGAINSISRNYRNAQGESVAVFLLCGQPMQIFPHTPDRCYPAQGFESLGAPEVQKFETPEGPVEYSIASFMRASEAGPQTVRVYWSYGNRGKWECPKNIKWAYGGSWAIYKIYVTIPITEQDPSGDRSAAVDFIRAFTAELDRSLFPDIVSSREIAPANMDLPLESEPSPPPR